MKVLMIEDDEAIRNGLEYYLEHQNVISSHPILILEIY